jgi:hypothetical protein
VGHHQVNTDHADDANFDRLKDGMKKEGPDLRPGRKWETEVQSGQHATNVFRQHFAPRSARNKP